MAGAASFKLEFTNLYLQLNIFNRVLELTDLRFAVRKILGRLVVRVDPSRQVIDLEFVLPKTRATELSRRARRVCVGCVSCDHRLDSRVCAVQMRS